MNTQELNIQIDFTDRMGLGHEVFDLLEKMNINLMGMEAKANQGMMIKFQCSSQDNIDRFVSQLKKIDGVEAISFKNHMPYEERERQLTTVLNSISEGIIAVNTDGIITHINEVAIRIFLSEDENIIGKKIEEFLHSEIPILETLKTGQPYRLKEVKMKRNGKVFHYLTSGVPILNEKGSIMGAVATIKDIKEVEEIISKMEAKSSLTTFDDIVHQSGNMRKLIDTAKIVAKGTSSILLRGESGTGKELFARAIHMESHRYNESFIAINCAALPESLLESELFGYEEGAFTGATKGGKKGLFEQADKGTLFLDEIGEISPQLQVRLLRVLQEGIIRRVGGSREIGVDVRIIAATHRNLEEMIKQGTFREDLYYRLNVIPLRIPSLRERPEDIPVISQHLVRKITTKLNKPEPYLGKEVIQYLMAQKWPGNVRQLENTLERIINIMNSPEIRIVQFQEWANLEPAKQRVHNNGNNINIEIPIKEKWPTLKEIVGEVEKQILLQVLKTHPTSRKAGNILGVSNTTILNKLKTYHIADYDID
ncbi:sigma 54-interacting transcriptional regulator [Tepidibacillus marianensis]|uniref:sigma 54-interacting transcriptional regulator n=1 Tax=Tepidibacillus marianensis TaxID=3131995 RepID=UPI0030CB1CDD